MPENSDFKDIEDTTCVQYPEKKADVSCESWYNLENNEVICSCLKQGLTVNIFDKAISNISKLKQFPILAVDICMNIFNKFNYKIIMYIYFLSII